MCYIVVDMKSAQFFCFRIIYCYFREDTDSQQINA